LDLLINKNENYTCACHFLTPHSSYGRKCGSYLETIWKRLR
jgi:hypothetical protein